MVNAKRHGCAIAPEKHCMTFSSGNLRAGQFRDQRQQLVLTILNWRITPQCTSLSTVRLGCGHKTENRLGTNWHGTLSHHDVRRVLPRLWVDPLHHGLDLLHGSALVELRDPLLLHLSHRLLPVDWVRQLPLHQRGDDAHVAAWPARLRRRVHPHRVRRRPHPRLHLADGRGQLVLGGLHQRRVESAARLQHLHLQRAGLRG
mmetsp:Transcript_100931/g.263170  ORF Transcript_100931/g.263170 Transcript_100931/m.263170 type:complete len:202 (-) Transcript_100931:813-1418(-)